MNFGQSQELAKTSLGLQFGISQSGSDTHTWGSNGEGLFTEAHFLFGINIATKISNSISFSIAYCRTDISGNDLNNDQLKFRGWNYSSPLSELSVNLRWYILSTRREKRRKIYNSEGSNIDFLESDLFSTKYFNHAGEIIDPRNFIAKRHTFNPYLILGINSTYIDPLVDYSETPPRPDLLQSDIDKQKNNYFHLSFGAGLNINLTDRISLDAEVRGVIPQTDLLDGISRTILEYNSERNKDSYQFALLRINYLLYEEENCDNDELVDKYDKCPCVQGAIELWGCPDNDSDGIVDKYDKCPNISGTAEFDGCPDGDSDGIPDYLDECPQIFGLYLFKGCPDRDADGIPDKNDECPDKPGSKSNKGCPN